MNGKRNWEAMVAAAGVALALAGTPAFAEKEGSGLRGGGQIIDVNGRPRLRDLVDKTTCRWVEAKDLLLGLPETAKVLADLGKAHWYLADVLVREAAKLRVCLTANLLPLPESEWRGVAVYERKRRQMAIRLNDMIFLDEERFRQLPKEDQVLGMIHEISHSFLPLGDPMRPDHLRTLVRAIDDARAGKINAKALGLNITMSGARLPPESAPLDPVKAELESLFDEQSSPPARLGALRRVGMASVRQLWIGDFEDIAVFAGPYYARARRALEQEDAKTLSRLIQEGVGADFPWFDGRTLIELAPDASSEVVQALLSSGSAAPALEKTRGVDEILLRMMRGEIAIASLDTIFRLNPDPNAILVRSDGRERALTLFGWSAWHGRTDIARRLRALGSIEPETVVEGWMILAGLGGEDRNALALEIADTGGLALGALLPTGRTPLGEAARAGNDALVSALLSRPAVDVNAKDAQDLTAFEQAYLARSAPGAGAIARDPRFKLALGESGSVVEKHERAKWMLSRFVELDLTQAVGAMLAQHKFGFFDLYPLAELARVRKFAATEAVIRKAMER